MVLRILISKYYIVFTQGTTHLGILSRITGIIGLLQSHFDVNNFSNFPVILHWSFTAESCPKKKLKIECLKVEIWSLHFIQVVTKTALYLKDATLLGLILCLARGNFCLLFTDRKNTINSIHTHVHCIWWQFGVKKLYYDFTLCCKLPLRGQVFIRPFAFKASLFINPPSTWQFDICLVIVLSCFMFVTIPPSCVTPCDFPHTDLAIYCFYFLPKSLFRMNSLQKKALCEEIFFCFSVLPVT